MFSRFLSSCGYITLLYVLAFFFSNVLCSWFCAVYVRMCTLKRNGGVVWMAYTAT
jgi:hypothetical protein